MATDSPKPTFYTSGLAEDGYSREDEATATCFCGAVQLAFPLSRPGLVKSFVCDCADCRKITASMFASNFIIDDSYLKHLRGQSNLKTFSQSKSVASGNTMTNHFCSTCGTLMYRVSSGWKNMSILRIGTVDDFSLAETKLKPDVEQWTCRRVAWFKGAEGIPQVEGDSF